MKIKLVVILMVLGCMFTIPQTASAHKTQSAADAGWWGNGVAYQDCLNRGNPPWSCFAFGIQPTQIIDVDSHTWWVLSYYQQATPQGGRRNCQVGTFWTHGQMTSHFVQNGC